VQLVPVNSKQQVSASILENGNGETAVFCHLRLYGTELLT